MEKRDYIKQQGLVLLVVLTCILLMSMLCLYSFQEASLVAKTRQYAKLDLQLEQAADELAQLLINQVPATECIVPQTAINAVDRWQQIPHCNLNTPYMDIEYTVETMATNICHYFLLMEPNLHLMQRRQADLFRLTLQAKNEHFGQRLLQVVFSQVHMPESLCQAGGQSITLGLQSWRDVIFD